MSNILPQEMRQRVWRMYCARFFIVGALILLICGVLACIALVPGYLALHTGEGASAQGAPGSASQQEDRTAIVHAQALLSTLSPLLSPTTASGLVATAVAERPATVQVYHITATAGNPGTIIISGLAGSIQAVSAYQTALRADKHFSGVSVPVGDLAGTAKGQFSITLSADFGI